MAQKHISIQTLINESRELKSEIEARRANERALVDRVRLEVSKLKYLGEVVGEMFRLWEVAASLFARFGLVGSLGGW